MTTFKARTTAPEPDNRNYFSRENPYVRDGWTMPNCTPYGMGRFHEAHGIWLPCRHNAEDWAKEAEAAGYVISDTPQLGSVAVWRCGAIGNGKDGAGHVSFVEEIKANADFRGSNSGWFENHYPDITQNPKYKKLFFYMQTFKASKNYSWVGSNGRTYEIVGFILPPKQDFEPRSILCVTGSLHLRTEAGKSNPSICIMRKNDKFLYDGKYKVVDETKWLHGNYKGLEGWASSKYMRKGF